MWNVGPFNIRRYLTVFLLFNTRKIRNKALTRHSKREDNYCYRRIVKVLKSAYTPCVKHTKLKNAMTTPKNFSFRPRPFPLFSKTIGWSTFFGRLSTWNTKPDWTTTKQRKGQRKTTLSPPRKFLSSCNSALHPAGGVLTMEIYFLLSFMFFIGAPLTLSLNLLIMCFFLWWCAFWCVAHVLTVCLFVCNNVSYF